MEEEEKFPKKLNETGREVPFRVPSGYFDTFYARLEDRISREQKASKERPVLYFFRPALAIAAGLALFALLLYQPARRIIRDNLVNSTQTYNGSSDEEYYTMMISNLDENSFYAILSDTEDPEKNNDEELSGYISSTITEYEILLETNNVQK